MNIISPFFTYGKKPDGNGFHPASDVSFWIIILPERRQRQPVP